MASRSRVTLVQALSLSPVSAQATHRVLRDRGGDAVRGDGADRHQRDGRLLEHGEERLLIAVERGQIPISIAVEIAVSDDEGTQRALHQAYESKKLRGKKLFIARRLIEQRKSKGKALRRGISHKRKKNISADALVRAYKQETGRLKQMVKKANLCEARLLFVVSAMKKLYADENFLNLLRAESLDTLPQYLADKIRV